MRLANAESVSQSLIHNLGVSLKLDKAMSDAIWRFEILSNFRNEIYLYNSLIQNITTNWLLTFSVICIGKHCRIIFFYYLLKIIQEFWLVKSCGWNRHIRSVVTQIYDIYDIMT